MVLLWDNIRCFFGNKRLAESDNIYMVILHALKMFFLGQYCTKMGHLTTFCRNINVIMGQYKTFF